MLREHLKIQTGLVMLALFGSQTASAKWTAGGGYLHRHDMKIEVEGSSVVQDMGLHATDPFFRPAATSALGGANAPSASTGTLSTTGFADRTFDDGFVNIGSTTGVPGSLAPDHTWFFNYTSATQYDAGSDTLDFHIRQNLRTSESHTESVRTRTTTKDDAVSDSERVSGDGFALYAGFTFEGEGPIEISIFVGLNYIQTESTHFKYQPFSEQFSTRKYRVSSVDTYDVEDTYQYVTQDSTGSSVDPTPRLNDPGSFIPTSFPAPLIPNVPGSVTRETLSQTRANTSTLINSTSFDAWNEVSLDVEGHAWQFWAGPRIEYRKEKYGFYAQPAVSLNYIEVEGERTETFYSDQGGVMNTLGVYRHEEEDESWSFGLSLWLGLFVDLSESWFLYAQYGYDWVADPASVQVGPNRVTFDPSGYTGQVGVGFSF